MIDSAWINKVEAFLSAMKPGGHIDIPKNVEAENIPYFIEMCKLRMQGESDKEYVFSDDYSCFYRIK